MSYRLIDANEIAMEFPKVNDMNCVYIDLPNGLDNQHHELALEQQDVPDICVGKNLPPVIPTCKSCKLELIDAILNASEYMENGKVYSYTYDNDTRIKHIREVLEQE